ncbi:hypothetical protein [Leptospira jelokensis]|uniref:Uncharacterized protein n=1 Tax=Leptospira jelokensis TaxID=2484931 RepID=A0A4Z0ZW20_9LEPT|nr:hypothetical protein [Leptospira jelokensis]TGL58587.1 hypothetical protein EHQ62_16970 [Leptospira jelokensis]
MNLYPYLKEELKLFTKKKNGSDDLNDYMPIFLEDHWEDLGFISHEHGMSVIENHLKSYLYINIHGLFPCGSIENDFENAVPESFMFDFHMALRLAYLSGTVRGRIAFNKMVRCLRLSYEIRRDFHLIKDEFYSGLRKEFWDRYR